MNAVSDAGFGKNGDAPWVGLLTLLLDIIFGKSIAVSNPP